MSPCLNLSYASLRDISAPIKGIRFAICLSPAPRSLKIDPVPNFATEPNTLPIPPPAPKPLKKFNIVFGIIFITLEKP